MDVTASPEIQGGSLSKVALAGFGRRDLLYGGQSPCVELTSTTAGQKTPFEISFPPMLVAAEDGASAQGMALPELPLAPSMPHSIGMPFPATSKVW